MSQPVAELVSVSHSYGKVSALSGVTLAFNPGQVTALLGPNGAGKTTAIGLLTGLLKPTVGQARLFGADPRSMPARRRMLTPEPTIGVVWAANRGALTMRVTVHGREAHVGLM